MNSRVSRAELAQMTARLRGAAAPAGRTRPEFAPGTDLIPHIRAGRLPVSAKIRRALDFRGASRVPVIDTPLVLILIAVLSATGVLGGLVLAAGWV